jgi:hypothetical protein
MKKYLVTYQIISSQPGAGQSITRYLECAALTEAVITAFQKKNVQHPSQTIAITYIYPIEG